MNTITINEKDFNEKLLNYKSDHYFDNFIFKEFRVISKREDFKVVYKIKINNENIIEVNYRLIKNNSFKECNFSFKETEGEYKFISTPNGDLVETYIMNILNTNNNFTNDEIVNEIIRTFRAEVDFIIQLKQYVMNESYKRTTVTKEIVSRDSKSNDNKKNRKFKNDSPTYLLKDIVEYVSSNHRNIKFTCECWNVRGHFRHYKNGKIVWIDSYEKGKNRNSSITIKERNYTI